jgi:hypothetical protein
MSVARINHFLALNSSVHKFIITTGAGYIEMFLI